MLKRDKESNRIERKGKREKRIKYDGEGGSELKKKWYKANMLNLFLNFCMCVQSLPRIDQELALPFGLVDLGFHEDFPFTGLVYHSP